LKTGADVDGDIALCEAANSARCFYRLVQMGVPFPHNAFGEYAGYQTDHDTRSRATSAGPLTSKFMTEALERGAAERHVPILDQTLVFELLTDEDGVRGLLALDMRGKSLVQINCAHVILCTGGAAHVYHDSVYPESQHGMTGMAVAAGAAAANLHCWQYGLASVGFRWNVSGSYQQTLPRFVSADDLGVERDFLLEALSPRDAVNLCFLKGYQWPFDNKKVPGSSEIDLLVKKQTDLGRRVYMDYRQNPAQYNESLLSDEAKAYLQNCGALLDTPIERLRAMNPAAIELYRAHGIDLERDRLEIKVCAQHHNGGIMVDTDWRSTVKGLYVAGEAAGTFGRARPGGSALNSTQVGSLRAAGHIARSSREIKGPCPLPRVALPRGDAGEIRRAMQRGMTACAAIERGPEAMEELLANVRAALENTDEMDVTSPDVMERLLLRDMLVTQEAVLRAMIHSVRSPEEGVLETAGGTCRYRKARPIPERELWFENVWREYQK